MRSYEAIRSSPSSSAGPLLTRALCRGPVSRSPFLVTCGRCSCSGYAVCPPTRAARCLLTALLPQPDEQVLAEAFGDGWDAAADRGRADGIIEVEDRAVRFTHPLLASAVAAEASERERRDAHRRLAGAAVDDVSRARHLALATSGPDEDVAQALEQAARETTRRGAPDSAAELAELARTLTPDGRPHDAYRRCTVAGEARFAAGDSARALELFIEATTLAAPGPERAEALWHLGRVRYQHDDTGAARELLERGRDEAGDDLGLRAAIDHDLAYLCLAMSDARATLQHARAAVELAERVGAVQILADALAQVVVSEFLLGEGVRWEDMDRARALEDWDQPRPALLRPSIAFAHVLSWNDRIDDAVAVLVQSERELVERGDTGALPFLWYHVAELDCWSGHWERGRARALDADRVAVQTRQQGTRPMTCYAVALLAAHLGDVDEARRYVDEGVRVASAVGHVLGAGLNLAVLAFLEFSLGHHDRAHALFDPLIRGARAGGFDEPCTAWWLPNDIESLVALGDPDAAAR